MAPHSVRSWEELQAQIVPILDELQADHQLTLAAAVNPLFALEEIGYHVDPQARPLIEERLRFPPRDVVRRQALREDINRLAGRPVDLASAEDLRALLYDELKLVSLSAPAQQAYRAATQAPIDTRPLPPQLSYRPKVADPLEVLSGHHPILAPLLEYRRLEASAPLLATRVIYDEVRQGKRELGIPRLRARLKDQPPPAPEPPTPVPGQAVNINTASVEALAAVPGLGRRLAQRIVDYRLAFGPFASVDRLADVSGIGPALLARWRPYLTV